MRNFHSIRRKQTNKKTKEGGVSEKIKDITQENCPEIKEDFNLKIIRKHLAPENNLHKKG